jgi:hypothetical protein
MSYYGFPSAGRPLHQDIPDVEATAIDFLSHPHARGVTVTGADARRPRVRRAVALVRRHGLLVGLTAGTAGLGGCHGQPTPSPPTTAAPTVQPTVPEREPTGAWTLKFVTLPDSPFLTDAYGDAPQLLWAVVAVDGDDSPYRIGSVEVEDRVDVPFADLVGSVPGVDAPPSTAWLVGPDGTCEADVDRNTTRLEVFEDFETEVAFSFDLTGCTGTAWAPVAIVAGTPAPGLRWYPAAVLPPEHPHAALQQRYRDLAAAAGHEPTYMEVVGPAALPVTTPMVVEVRYGHVDEEDGCTLSLQNALGVATDGAFEPWSCPLRDNDDCSMYQLLGSVGTPRQTHFAVLIDHFFQPTIRTVRDEGRYTPSRADDFAFLPYISPPSEDEHLSSFAGLYPCIDDEEYP